MFPKNFRNETQVIALVMSADKENDPDVIGINAAGAALALSDIPFGGPIGAVRVGQVNGEFIVNPTYAERLESKLNITVVATKDGVVMIESGATGVSEDTVVDAIEFGPAEIKKICAVIDQLVAKAVKPQRLVRKQVTKDRIRAYRRSFEQIREITIEVGVLPRVHGSALFTRGETQALVTVTLGTTDDQQRLETFQGEQRKRFMLHYNFPPFSVGEVGRMTGVGRREIGHGALAERAIAAVLPGEDESPYTMRVVSDILESNGSSSMASVCGASLALMQAGIPLKGAVAGVAMGLVKEGDDYAILTDIAGAEDHYGDMDFKVAGTRAGITALQMDIKISGVTGQIMREALEQARRGRLFLLDKMDEVQATSNLEKSKFAPQIHTLQIPTDKIRDLIGPGGKTIRGIIEATGVKIDVDDTGRVNVASSDEEGLKKALAMISDLTAVPEVGKTYLGKVVRLAEFGAFVEIFPGTDGLLHISEIAEHRVKDVKDELREGDQVLVKVLGIEGNRIKLSRKALLREQREKLGLPEPGRGGQAGDNGGGEAPAPRAPRPQSHAPVERQPSSNASTITIEGGEEFDDDEPFVEGGERPNFNRADGTSDAGPAEVRRPAAPGGAAAGQRRRRHRSRGRGP